jgi:hypothetical protein
MILKKFTLSKSLKSFNPVNHGSDNEKINLKKSYNFEFPRILIPGPSPSGEGPGERSDFFL